MKVVKCSILISLIFFMTIDLNAGGSQKEMNPVQIRIVKLSKLPPTETLPYEECLLYHKVENLSFKQISTQPRFFIAAFWGLYDRKRKDPSTFNEGDLFKTVLVPYDQTPEEVQTAQYIDNIEDWDLEVFFVQSYKK